MPPLDGTESIEDNEILYRRIPVSMGWYDPTVAKQPSPEAFRPRADDTTGISLSRAGVYCTIEQAGQGPSKKGYYVVSLKPAGELRKRGIRIEPRPVDGNPGHVEFPDLTFANRDTDVALSLTVLLANELCDRVDGPFVPPAQPAAKAHS